MRNSYWFLKYKKLDTTGFTIVELLTAISLVAVVIMSTNFAALGLFNTSQTANVRIARDRVINQIRGIALNKTALSNTLSQHNAGINTEFYNCACGKGTCLSVQTPNPMVKLYDAAMNLQSPAYYDSAGQPCIQTQSNLCILRVQTTFYAECAPDLSTNLQNPQTQCGALGGAAEFVAISYTIDQNPNAAVAQKTTFKPISGQAIIDPNSIDPTACL